jgi:hypothetical protein
LVQAWASQDLFAVAAAGAGGKFGGLAGAVTVGTVKSNTTADVGDNAFARALNGDVAVTAVDTTRAFGAAGSLAIAAGALAGGVDVAIVNPNVQARLGLNTVVSALQGDVAVAALSQKDVQSAAISAAGGKVGVAGAVSVVSAGTGLSPDAERSLEANDSGNTVTTGAYVDEVARGSDVTGLLGNYQSNTSNSDSEKRAAAAIASLSASAGAASPSGKAAAAFASTDGGVTRTLVSAGSLIIAGRAVTVAGRDRMAIDQTTGSVAGGLAAFGGAVGVATVADLVNVQMAGAVRASGNVTVAADYDSNLAGGAGAGLGSSNGVTLGLVGLGAQVTRFTDNSTTAVNLSGSVAQAGTLTVEATRDRTLGAKADGVTAGGVVVGVAQARADAGGSNTVTITGQVGQIPGAFVNNLVVNARSVTLASANTKAVAAGVLSGAGSDASATQTSVTPDGVFLTGARITVANDAAVNATSEQRSHVFADGLNVGLATAGASVASAVTSPEVYVQLTGVTLTAGRDVRIGSSAQALSVADATASGGGLFVVGGGATVSTTSKPLAHLNTETGATGVPTRVSAGGTLTLQARNGDTALGTAANPSYAFASLGAATARGNELGGASIHIGAGTGLTAGTDLTVSASESQAFVAGSVLVGYLEADGAGNAASSSLIKSSTVAVNVGDGATLTAGGRLTVNATAFGDANVRSSAAKVLSGPARPSSATSTTVLHTSVWLGNSNLSGRDVSLSASNGLHVTNQAAGSTNIFTGGKLLKQNDTATLIATVNSGTGFRLTAASLAPTASATASAVNGSTNDDPRTFIDTLDRTEDVSLKGQKEIG